MNAKNLLSKLFGRRGDDVEMVFLSYSNPAFRSYQIEASAFAAKEGFDKIISKTEEDLTRTPFYSQFRNILEYVPRKGAGFCLWKPYYILECLSQMRDGDILVYSDCADVLRPGILRFVKSYLRGCDYLLVQNPKPQREYTKRDCFFYMGCDDEKYWEAKQLEAGFCAFVKTEQTVRLVNEWLKWCSDERVLVTKPNECGLDDLPGYVDHRYDQSVLTNIAVKDDLSTIPMGTMGKYINYNARLG